MSLRRYIKVYRNPVLSDDIGKEMIIFVDSIVTLDEYELDSKAITSIGVINRAAIDVLHSVEDVCKKILTSDSM